MEIKKAGSQPSAKVPSDWFTGTVRIEPLFQAPEPALVQSASVTLEPARGRHGIRICSVRPSHRSFALIFSEEYICHPVKILSRTGFLDIAKLTSA